VELTYTAAAGIWANISYVDFVGMILGMMLTSTASATQSTPGLTSDGMQSICNGLENQTTTDGYPWNELCLYNSDGQPHRILSPGDYVQVNPAAFSDYWTSYVDSVWSTYTTQTLTINSQSGAVGNVSCTVSGGDTMTCDGDDGTSATFSKPASADIFGCNSGPFAIDSAASELQKAVVPRLCAAFNRSTFLLDGGNVQPDGVVPTSYYAGETTNWYSKLVHQYEVDGRGYAFSYDDVTPDVDLNTAQSQSGELVSSTPQALIVTIDGFII
jgi:hypothetical protein